MPPTKPLPSTGPSPASVPAGEFKARCLDLLDQVKERSVEYIVTKRGQPFARLVPIETGFADPFGLLRGTVLKGEDLVRADHASWASAESDPLESA
jgi:prevent-host-death family protein